MLSADSADKDILPRAALSDLAEQVRRRYPDQPPRSAEAMAQLAALPAASADRLHEDLHGDYLIPCAVATPGHLFRLLSMRHHGDLSFQLTRLWAELSG